MYMFKETKKYLEKKKPTLKQAAALGKGLVQEFLNPNDAIEEPIKKPISSEKPGEKVSPEVATKDFFYTPYVQERTKIVKRLHGEGVDVTQDPIAAAFVSLIAASTAGHTSYGASSKADGYAYEFRLPEQYFFDDTAVPIDQYTKRASLLEETKGLAAEIVQAWMLVDSYAGEINPVSSIFNIPHNSLRKTTCSFMSTCVGTDLTFGDIGIESVASPDDLIGEYENFNAVWPGSRIKASIRTEILQEVTDSFMSGVQRWDQMYTTSLQ